MKQTSVDWLFQTLCDVPNDKITWSAMLKIAKEIHKTEIMFAYYDGLNATENSVDPVTYYNNITNN